MKRAALALICLVPLVACGPVPVAQAEKTCLERARLAQQPRGTISVGGNSDGKMVGGLELTVSSDYLTGRDPAEVFKSCVKAASGEFPSRPLYDQPGWVR